LLTDGHMTRRLSRGQGRTLTSRQWRFRRMAKYSSPATSRA
jgi:hypothetical protein